MYEPKIYVIIPVYNCKDYLPEAVESVLSQPYQKIEVYLIDDGSTDGSSHLCDTLAAEHGRVRAFHQKNGGVSAARNTGIDQVLALACNEDYIGFCDSDDRWVENAITDGFFADFDVRYIHTFGTIKANQELSRFHTLTRFDDKIEPDIRKTLWLPGHLCASLYSCNMLRTYQLHFSKNTKYCEDVMFETMCKYCAGSIQYHNRYLYIYRHNSSSAMHGARRKMTKVNYYLQIIDGWMETETLINFFAPQTGRTTVIGSTLVSIYFMDMAAKHYQDWGSRRELEQAFAASPHYHLFETMKEKDVSPRQYHEHLLLKNHHALFRLKHNLLGIPNFLVESAYRIPFVKDLYIRRKYPLTQIPKN